MLITCIQLPIISSKDGQASSSTNVPTHKDLTPWHPCTDIILQPYKDSTRSFTIAVGAQNPSIKSIIGAAIHYGALQLVIDDKFCGLSSTGLQGLTAASLIHCSDAEGFDGEFDISDRLERGSDVQYIKPLVKYVRICFFSGQFISFEYILRFLVALLPSDEH